MKIEIIAIFHCLGHTGSTIITAQRVCVCARETESVSDQLSFFLLQVLTSISCRFSRFSTLKIDPLECVCGACVNWLTQSEISSKPFLRLLLLMLQCLVWLDLIWFFGICRFKSSYTGLSCITHKQIAWRSLPEPASEWASERLTLLVFFFDYSFDSPLCFSPLLLVIFLFCFSSLLFLALYHLFFTLAILLLLWLQLTPNVC